MRRIFVRFIDFLNKNDISSFSDLDTTHLYEFIGNHFQNCDKKGKNRALSGVRNLLEYLHTQGVVIKVFDHAFPHIRVFDDSSGIPNVFTKDEVTKLLAAVDRGSPIGKRDYAILLIATRYGLRAGDIRELKFENINWTAKTITIVQSKTGNPLSLPLLEDVGWSIIEYIRSGRPNSDCPYIFVIHNAPYDRFLGSMNHIVERYMRLAQIPVKKNTMPGMHALRHSLADELLRNDIPIPIIKEVLGHARLATTNRYQKIDIGQLATCALEVPYDSI
jgi:site-specific recombinase XerD